MAVRRYSDFKPVSTFSGMYLGHTHCLVADDLVQLLYRKEITGFATLTLI
jgi:hypothetical protein